MDDKTTDAVGKLRKALETTERARGHLYSFHQLTGTADFELGDAVEALRAAGHEDHADRVQRELLGHDVLSGRWTFQVVEEYDDSYYDVFRDVEQAVRDDLADGERHGLEKRMKEERQRKSDEAR
ncbi:hypothetical protein [Lentzea sp. NBRC 102530]|uniref:hypothetical protein n=1 Tax=Lentzea sp. NBRC 102530 TaxID=3032201 RepID=UPI002556305F|nr:hypothetical protein [Lentzea sp. NBRC 102530]